MSLFGIGSRFYKPFNRRFAASPSFNTFRKRGSGGHKFNSNRLMINKFRRRYGSRLVGRN